MAKTVTPAWEKVSTANNPGWVSILRISRVILERCMTHKGTNDRNRRAVTTSLIYQHGRVDAGTNCDPDFLERFGADFPKDPTLATTSLRHFHFSLR